ncbi:4823_t:CDS:2, partial [Gigaspora margarita]
IKQGDKESVKEFTNRCDSCVILWNSELLEEKKVFVIFEHGIKDDNNSKNIDDVDVLDHCNEAEVDKDK